MRTRAFDVAAVAGGLALWGLYRTSPEWGRTASLVISVVFLVSLIPHFIRRWQTPMT